MDHHEPDSRINLNICVRCRDGREVTADADRGGARLADAVLAALERRRDLPPHALLGVRCMSQCKRPCTISLSAAGRFTYLFGDLDPERDADAVLDLLPLYAAAPDGFMPRDRRPVPAQAGILGRIPPLGVSTGLVAPLRPLHHAQKEQNR